MSDEFEIEETMSSEKPEGVAVDDAAQGHQDSTRGADENQAAPTPVTGDRLGVSGPSLASVIDVPLRLTVEIGAAKMLVREVLQLNKGSIVPLDRTSGDPADILVNGRLIARGEVTVLDESLAVRIVELVGREESAGGR